MSDDPHGIRPGVIRRCYTVECTECQADYTEQCNNAAACALSLRSQGWSIRAGGWVCKACSIEHTKDLVTAHEGRPIVANREEVRKFMLEKSQQIKLNGPE